MVGRCVGPCIPPGSLTGARGTSPHFGAHRGPSLSRNELGGNRPQRSTPVSSYSGRMPGTDRQSVFTSPSPSLPGCLFCLLLPLSCLLVSLVLLRVPGSFCPSPAPSHRAPLCSPLCPRPWLRKAVPQPQVCPPPPCLPILSLLFFPQTFWCFKLFFPQLLPRAANEKQTRLLLCSQAQPRALGPGLPSCSLSQTKPGQGLASAS